MAQESRSQVLDGDLQYLYDANLQEWLYDDNDPKPLSPLTQTRAGRALEPESRPITFKVAQMDKSSPMSPSRSSCDYSTGQPDVHTDVSESVQRTETDGNWSTATELSMMNLADSSRGLAGTDPVSTTPALGMTKTNATHVSQDRARSSLFVSSPKDSHTSPTHSSAHTPHAQVIIERDVSPALILEEVVDDALASANVVCNLKAWQQAMGRDPFAKQGWHDMTSEETRAGIEKKEQKRQNIIFELIQGEMDYVRDLESIEKIYVIPLLEADPPIIPSDRVDGFVRQVFNNFSKLHAHHQRLLEQLHGIQANEHPVIRSVSMAFSDAAQAWREAYMEYIPHYPIAKHAVDLERLRNPLFDDFVHQCSRHHPDARRQDVTNFVHRPIARLARYELLLRDIIKASTEHHKDRRDLPGVIEAIVGLVKETNLGVARTEMEMVHANLVFRPGTHVDMQLVLDDCRSLIHSGKLLKQETGYGWSNLHVLLFDTCLVITKPKERDGETKYHVLYRPIPLDMLTAINFTDPPTQRGAILPRLAASGQNLFEGAPLASAPGPGSRLPPASDARVVYPCAFDHVGRLGRSYVFYSETPSSRIRWKEKINEARESRKATTEAKRVFKVEMLSVDTFLLPTSMDRRVSRDSPGEVIGKVFGRVTCSVPFTATDGRNLVAIGCTEGVWIGSRLHSGSMRRVLELSGVTQCAVLECDILLVLADKSLFAYHLEELIQAASHSSDDVSAPQKLNGNKEAQFFSVGRLGERTLVIFMEKKGMDSLFRILELVVDKVGDNRSRTSLGLRLGFRQAKGVRFKVYKDFFLPSESYDLVFLKSRIAVVCSKGFEIMDPTNFKTISIPQRDDAKYEKLAKRCNACKPMGMFKTGEDEYLLCYTEFGMFVNRHGEPSLNKPLIEWEGTAGRVVWHPPHIIIFDRRFIEVRTVEEGRLVQIIPGDDVRATWGDRGTSQLSSVYPRRGHQWQEMFELKTRIHGVMRASPPEVPAGQVAVRPPALVSQHVFELVPIMLPSA